MMWFIKTVAKTVVFCYMVIALLPLWIMLALCAYVAIYGFSEKSSIPPYKPYFEGR